MFDLLTVRMRKRRDHEGSMQTVIDVMPRMVTPNQGPSLGMRDAKHQSRRLDPLTGFEHELSVNLPERTRRQATAQLVTELHRLGKEVLLRLRLTARSSMAKFSLRLMLNGPRFAKVMNAENRHRESHHRRSRPARERVVLMTERTQSLQVKGRKRLGIKEEARGRVRDPPTPV